MLAFRAMIDRFRDIAAIEPADELALHVIKETDFLTSLGAYGQPDDG